MRAKFSAATANGPKRSAEPQGRRAELANLPTRVRIDASSKCQLRCPICPTARMENKAGVVGWGHLRQADFRNFLDSNPGIEHVELSNWGEIFLNPDLKAIVELADDRGVSLSGSGGVNLNHANEAVLEAMVRTRFRHLDVSIDGATQETYARYRQNGQLEHVITNVRRINHYKEALESPYPELTWKFIVFGHNEHEIPEARAMAASLGMEFRPSLNFGEIWGRPEYSPIRNPAAVKRDTGMEAATTDEYRDRFRTEYLIPCQQLWDAPQINWDGKLLGCCHNVWGQFGNVFEVGFEHALSAERYRYTKLMLLGEAPARDDIPCSRCSIYARLRGDSVEST